MWRNLIVIRNRPTQLEEANMMNKYKLVFITIVSLFTVAFLAAPASAGCGFFGCGGTLVYVQPQPYVYQSCSCCGCGGSSYYGAPSYVYQPNYYYGGYGGSYYRSGHCNGYGGDVWGYGGGC